MARLFNCIPGHIRDIKERPTEYFKKQLDKWLRGVPDQLKCGVAYILGGVRGLVILVVIQP